MPRRLQMRRPPRTHHDSVDLRVPEEPRDREGGRFRAAPTRLLAEALDGARRPLARKVPVRLGTQRHPRSGRRRGAVHVLPGQPAPRERTERREPNSLASADGQDIRLGLAIEERERVLHPAEAREPTFRADAEGLLEPPPLDVAGADRPDTPIADESVER